MKIGQGKFAERIIIHVAFGVSKAEWASPKVRGRVETATKDKDELVALFEFIPVAGEGGCACRDIDVGECVVGIEAYEGSSHPPNANDAAAVSPPIADK